MPNNVSSVNSVKKPGGAQEKEAVVNAVPQGISSSGSSMKSAASEIQSKSTFRKIQDCFINIFKSIKNLFASIFYRIYYWKAPPSKIELKLTKFVERKERADSLSEELALKEAEEFPIAFSRVGKEIFHNSYNLIWKARTSFSGHTYYEIGKEEAQKNPKILIPHLKAYYDFEINMLENQIRRGQNLD